MLADSVAGTNVAPGTAVLKTAFTLTFSLAAAQAEGVMVATAGTTCIIPVPDAAAPLLAYRTAAALALTLGDGQAYSQCMTGADELEKQLTPLLSERVEGEPRRLLGRGLFGRTRGLFRGV
jgi:hypothetical protein